jgi:hypothetical protein
MSVPEAESVPAKPKGGKLAQRAGILCNEGAFAAFFASRYTEVYLMAAKDPASILRHICGVLSRAELDSQPTAADRFHEIESEYKAWLTVQ